jgi:hypothetical protein
MHLPLRVFTVQWGIPQNIARIDRGLLYVAETPAKRYILKRAVLSRAVGTHPVAIDNQQRYRPRESPGNCQITYGAGGILRCSSGKTNAVAFSAVRQHRLGVFKAASNTFVANEQASVRRIVLSSQQVNENQPTTSRFC